MSRSIIARLMATTASVFEEPPAFYSLPSISEPGRCGKQKRYRASIRQHQRHAAKLRNKAAHRRANR